MNQASHIKFPAKNPSLAKKRTINKRSACKNKTSKRRQERSYPFKSASKGTNKTNLKSLLNMHPPQSNKRKSHEQGLALEAFTNQKLKKMPPANERKCGMSMNRPSGCLKEGDQIEEERVQVMEEYLRRDAKKLEQMKEISNRHIISEMRLTQESLKRKLEGAYQQSKVLIETHKRQLREKNKKQESMFQRYQKQKGQLRSQLLGERRKSQALEAKVKEQESLIAHLQEKIYLKQVQPQQPAKKMIHPQFVQNPQANQSKELDTEIAGVEDKMKSLYNSKRDLEMEIEKHLREKRMIRSQAEKVLGFLQQELAKCNNQSE